MKLNVKWLLAYVLVICAAQQSLHAAFIFQNGRFIDACEAATMSAQEHFMAGATAIETDDWPEAAIQFGIVAQNFPATPYGKDSFYYLGVSYYYLEEFDFANEAFTNYLKVQSNPLYFQDTITYKFLIAEQFASGAKRRFFGTKKLPKWASGDNLALEIYDEVIAAVPCEELAAQALLSKGWLLWCTDQFRPAIDSFQLLIRRFPKHELAPECYLLISKVYLEQSQKEFQNPDILAFAAINLRRFQKDFPREERLCEVEADLMAIKEVYAEGLYDTGQYYERKRKWRASMIYYHNAIHQFPDTCIAGLCRQRMMCLDPSYCDPADEEDIPCEPVCDYDPGEDIEVVDEIRKEPYCDGEDDLYPSSQTSRFN